MALSDFLFNGSPPPSVTSSNQSIQGLPDWYQDYQKATLAQANAIAASPYPAYSGEMVAPLTGLQQQAAQAAAGSWQVGQPQFTTASNTLSNSINGAANPSAGIQSWMDTYNSDVTNMIAKLGQRNLTENLLPAVNDTFTGAGQFGSGRNADFNARTVRDANESILNQQAQVLQQGFQNAAGNFLNANGQQIQAGQTLGALGQTMNNTALSDIAAQDQLGQEAQNTQQNLDTALHNEFLNQANYPRQNVGFLSSVLQGQQVPTTTTTLATQPGNNFQPSGLSQIAGAATGAAALSRLFGG